MIFGRRGIARGWLLRMALEWWYWLDTEDKEDREDVFERKCLPLVSHIYLHHYINIHQGLLESSCHVGILRTPRCTAAIYLDRIIIDSQHLADLVKSSYSNASNFV